MSEWTNECKKKRVTEWTNNWMSEWMNEHLIIHRSCLYSQKLNCQEFNQYLDAHWKQIYKPSWTKTEQLSHSRISSLDCLKYQDIPREWNDYLPSLKYLPLHMLNNCWRIKLEAIHSCTWLIDRQLSLILNRCLIPPASPLTRGHTCSSTHPATVDRPPQEAQYRVHFTGQLQRIIVIHHSDPSIPTKEEDSLKRNSRGSCRQ